MIEFNGRIAVVTGGGTGMGRELVRQLVAEGCSVAMCDVSATTMAETKRLCEAAGVPQGVRITAHLADVGKEDQILAFRDAVAKEHDTDRIHFLFNNAGIGGGGSFVAGDRDEWERTFNVCWYGVYYSTRAFMPMLLKADRAHITNTSSVNGFWASLGPAISHTAYPAAKFAVKGFTEGLITDLRLNAPHVTCSVVMPGHIGTAIASNTRRVLANTDSDEMSDAEVAHMRTRMTRINPALAALSDDDLRKMAADGAARFQNEAPTSAAEAATIILDGVKATQWRILVGEDAKRLDENVRHDPGRAYDADFQNGLASIAATATEQK